LPFLGAGEADPSSSSFLGFFDAAFLAGVAFLAGAAFAFPFAGAFFFLARGVSELLE
jgi:hypothetical protein